MKNVLAGLLMALVPTVALAETEGQERLISDLQDIGIFIVGHTSGCGVANQEKITNRVGTLASAYKLLDKDGVTEKEVKELFTLELVAAADVGEGVIQDKGCFVFNTYIVEHRYDMYTVDDIFSLYIPTSDL